VTEASLAWKLSRTFVAVALIIIAELTLVFVLRRSQLTAVWEVQFGTLWLLPLIVLTVAVGAAVGLVGVELARGSERRGLRVLLCLILAGFGAAVAWGVGGGRHLSSPLARGGFAFGVALAGGVLTWIVAPHVARARPDRLALISLLSILALEVANRFLLVRSYPAFHAGLAALVLFLGAFAASGWRAPAGFGKRHARFASLALLLLVTGAAVAAPASATRLGRFDNVRWILLDHAPLGGQIVRLAAELSPPPVLDRCGEDPSDDCEVALEPASRERSLEFRGRDILLVTIDALRADHVGSYGYAKPTTPGIDALAREGARFAHAYAQTPHTSYSLTSLMTGKYIRPLLLQGVGADSDTWATLARTYGYRTAGFYPPAVFFIDGDRFGSFREKNLGFEYAKVEFLEGQGRVDQVREYLSTRENDQRVFLWVHLFSPHEPYEAHAGHSFGERDIDRYDSEIAYADETLRKIVRLVRDRQPESIVIVAADHGEEFGDHGGRYHGTSVYEEQVRVPLVISAPGAISAQVIDEPVQNIDILPTVLGALDVPRPPRLRGRDLGALLAGKAKPGEGLALSETEEQVLLAQGNDRLVCQRKVGACQLYDVSTDPGQRTDRSHEAVSRLKVLRDRLKELSASHGRYELLGLRAEGKGWPAPLRRALAGDGDAAEDVAALLDDADVTIRRKAAEVLFDLKRPETAAALRLSVSRDEDLDVKRWSALTLTRLDQGAPLVYEVFKSGETKWQRLAALALAESGDKRGAEVLIAWWKDDRARDYSRSRELLDVFGKLRIKDAVWPLCQSLGDVRLRPYIADALAAIGDEVGRGPLAKAFASERYQSARIAIAKALVKLDAEAEMAVPLIRFLGVPDPLPNGLDIAMRAKILENVGGPKEGERKRLMRQSDVGAAVLLVVPAGGNGKGVRVIVRGRNRTRATDIHVGAPADALRFDTKGKPVKQRSIPRISPDKQLVIRLPKSDGMIEVNGVLPKNIGAHPRRPLSLVVFADSGTEIEALAAVPLADELPPPPPEPWKK
jgi:arylsulfatase A-like enzyme